MSEAGASHLPVLRQVGKHFHIAHVLEFGCGKYSTPLFLDRAAFPHVTRVRTLESNAHWAKWARDTLKDERLEVVHCDEKEAISRYPGPVDLVFVDGATPEWRVPSVRSGKWLAQIIVLHDAEQYVDSQVLTEFRFCRINKEPYPWTAVLSTTLGLGALELCDGGRSASS